MTARTVRIGSSSAAWGDTIHGAGQLVTRGSIHYLVGDYLAEVTMALLARARAKDPAAGFVPDWLASVRDFLPQIAAQGIRLVTNAGGMNPLACRSAFEAAAAAAGLSFRVAVVQGDDLMPRSERVRELAPREMSSGAPLPARLASMNAYLGASAIARALDAGADVVITGRCVDSALVLGPLMHEFGWGENDYDRLAAGSLAGHVIECGCQATGGLFTDWQDVADGWDDMGFPIVECAADGSFVVSKPAGTGGLVSCATVAEQILYEIADPRAYRLPDVNCDFSATRLEQAGPDRVRVSGVRGRSPGGKYKVCATWGDGFRVMTTFLVAGWQADRKGRRVAEALINRCARLLAQQGFAPFSETSVEVMGAEDSYGANRRVAEAREVVVKIGLRHPEPKALEIFAREFAVPGVSMAQGVSGAFGGRPAVQPVLRVFSFLLDKREVPVSLSLDGDDRAVAVAVPDDQADPEPLDTIAVATLPEDAIEVPLRALAWGRSGDKGNDANIGVIAREAAFAPYIKAGLDAARVAVYFGHYLEGEVLRYELPGLNAFNFLLRDVLAGGGTGSLRYDPLAKTYAQILLDIPIRVPRHLLESTAAEAG